MNYTNDVMLEYLPSLIWSYQVIDRLCFTPTIYVIQWMCETQTSRVKKNIVLKRLSRYQSIKAQSSTHRTIWFIIYCLSDRKA